ncbi:MAG: phytoene desaturase family protein [Promethearchaeota archaeon]
MVENKTSLIIIGGGITGISTGCYGQMNGFSTQIFEMNPSVGGCCTAWKRDGYTIDTCIHWLMGSRPPSPFYNIWEELGVIQDKTLVDHELYVWIKMKDGRIFSLPKDLDDLRAMLLKYGPKDGKIINKLIKAIKKCQKMPISIEKPMALFSKLDFVKYIFRMLPYGLFFKKLTSLSLAKFSEEFESPILQEMFREALSPSFGENPDLPMFNILMTLAMMSQKTVCYPLGGSLGITNSIKKRYLSLGGEIHTNSKVMKILVKNNRAIGIRLENGKEIFADYVISTADGYETIFNMLEGSYISDQLQNYYKEFPLVKPIIQVGLGVEYDFQELPESVAGYTLPVETNITIAEKSIPWLLFQAYIFDSSLAPTGKTFVKAMIGSNYNYWAELYNSPEEYKKEKNKVAQMVINEIDHHFPGFADGVDMIDVATPVSFYKWTGNQKGAYMGWRVTPDIIMKLIPNTLPDLSHFYMAGQWVKIGGGLPTAAVAGRDIIQILCDELDQDFITTKP